MLIGGGVVAVIANSKNFDVFGWFFYGALVWPIALAHVIVKPARVQPISAPDGAIDAVDASTKVCPECAETIKAGAVVCRFCGNRSFTAEREISEEDAFFSSFTPYRPKPQPTMWQKLWWNPHADDQSR